MLPTRHLLLGPLLLLLLCHAPQLATGQLQDFGSGLSNFGSGLMSRFTDTIGSFGSRFRSGASGLGSSGAGPLSSLGSRLQSGIGSFGQNIPILGTCDRIVYQGAANCLSNFGPSKVGSKGSCCAYRKYRACIAGLDDGLKLAVDRARCPKRTLSMPFIHRMSDLVVGLPLSQCKNDKNACKRSKSKH